MDSVVKFVNNKVILVKIVIWLRSFFSENKIPDTVMSTLKTYIPKLSEKIPNIEKINEYLKNDINYLNSKEEFNYIKNNFKDVEGPSGSSKADLMHIIKKYYNIKIISCYDIIEWWGIKDRVFVLDIDMDGLGNIYSLYKQNTSYFEQPFYFTVKLSSLVSKF